MIVAPPDRGGLDDAAAAEPSVERFSYRNRGEIFPEAVRKQLPTSAIEVIIEFVVPPTVPEPALVPAGQS